MIDGPGLWIIEPFGVAPMPMQTGLQIHVKSNQDDRCCPELEGKIERLKSAVATPPDDTRNIENQFIATRATFDLVNVPEPLSGHPILGELQSLEGLASFMDTPPLPVAGVEGFGPRADLVRIVDGEGFDVRLPRTFEVDGFDAWAAADDDDDESAPVWPPGWEAGFSKGRGSCGAASRACAAVRVCVCMGCLTVVILDACPS